MPKEREVKQVVIEFEGGKTTIQWDLWFPTDMDIDKIRELSNKLTKRILKKNNNTYITYREK